MASYKAMLVAPSDEHAKLKPGRNAACDCGSGRKYKVCCLATGLRDRALLPANQQERLSALASAGEHALLESRATELLIQYPNCGVLYKFLSLALWAQGKDAVSFLRRAAELLPYDAEAHGNLGNVLRAIGRPEDAVESQWRAVELRPDHVTYCNLGSVLQDLGRFEEATAKYRQAIACRPKFALAHSNLANVLSLGNFSEEAERSCRRALEIEPRFTAAIVQLAELRAGTGDFISAEQLLRRALSIDPECAEALAGLARLRKMTRTAADAAWLEQARGLAGRGLGARREVHLRYALGKYFDDIGEYEQAFAEYQRANELGKIGRPAYERVSFSAGIDRLIQNCDGPWMLRAQGSAHTSERPVLIVGMPRSGTTLAEQILASHGEVCGAGELPFWNTAASRHAAGEKLPRLADEYLGVLQSLSADARRVVDKMPANFLYLGLIHAALPKARIVHLTRDPLDTCLSIYFQNFGALHPYANDLEDLAHYYGQYLRLIEHWRHTLPSQAMLTVPYEGLVADPEGWSRRMLEFIGLDWDPNCLKFHENRRVLSTFSKWQARQRINTASVERWRHYQAFLAPLSRLKGV